MTEIRFWEAKSVTTRTIMILNLIQNWWWPPSSTLRYQPSFLSCPGVETLSLCLSRWKLRPRSIWPPFSMSPIVLTIHVSGSDDIFHDNPHGFYPCDNPHGWTPCGLSWSKWKLPRQSTWLLSSMSPIVLLVWMMMMIILRTNWKKKMSLIVNQYHQRLIIQNNFLLNVVADKLVPQCFIHWRHHISIVPTIGVSNLMLSMIWWQW